MAINAEKVIAVVKASSAATSRKEMLKMISTFAVSRIQSKVISLNLQIDTDICSMYEYFEIFLQRMLMCRGAADMLGAAFKLTANGAKVL